MTVPGFSAEVSVYARGGYRQVAGPRAAADDVVAAIPPCHACDDIIDKCLVGRLRGAICRYCAVGHCDPQDWKDPRFPFPHSEPWDVPF